MVVEQMSHWRLVKDFPITKVMMGFKIYIKLKKVWLQSTIWTFLRWRTIWTTKQTNLLEYFFKNQEKNRHNVNGIPKGQMAKAWMTL